MENQKMTPEEITPREETTPPEETPEPAERAIAIQETSVSPATQETVISPAPLPQSYDAAPTTPTLLATAQEQANRFLARFKRWRDRWQVWNRLAQVRRWRIIFVIIFLVAFVAPLLTLGATALLQYNQLKGWGQDGVNQLLSIKQLLPSSVTAPSKGGKGGSGSSVDKAKDILNKAVLDKISAHCAAAQEDFQHINSAIANRDGIIGIAMTFGYRSKILAVQQLALVGIDGTILCQKLTALGADFTSTFKTSPFSSSGGPILTQKSFTDIGIALDDAQQLLADIQTHMQQINPNDLPVSPKQRDQIAQYTAKIPKLLQDIATFKPYLPLAGWALGVDSPRNYLIQTMDRGEIRPTGGFNGQWGILNINGGRIGKLSLTDVTFVDFTTQNTPTLRQLPPVPYRSWWVFANWGMRDADLSADFPTSAKIIMDTFQREEAAVDNGIKVHLDGDIHFSPLVIEHLLKSDVLGPLYMPCYNVTITSTNLEDELHFFQETGAGQAIQSKCSPKTGNTSLRKRFTSQLAQSLEDKVRNAGQDKLLAILNSVRQDLADKNLEIYVTNPQIESLLAKDHLDASINNDPHVDETYIVNANVGINKGWTQVAENVNESIALDDSGGAFHDLVISLNYQPVHSVYGIETIRDYLRVYVPTNARFYFGSGFDQNIQPMYTYTPNPQPQQPLCKPTTPTPTPSPTATTSPTPVGTMTPTPPPHKGKPALAIAPQVPPAAPQPQPPAPVASPFPCTPTEAPTCAQQWNPGGSANNWLPHTPGSNSSYIDDIGGPTNFVSDDPQRAMYGGMVVIQGFCTATVELQWYVPGIAGTSVHQNLPYTHLYQRQSGTFANYTLRITPASDVKIPPINAQVNQLGHDQSWSLKAPTEKTAEAYTLNVPIWLAVMAVPFLGDVIESTRH